MQNVDDIIGKIQKKKNLAKKYRIKKKFAFGKLKISEIKTLQPFPHPDLLILQLYQVNVNGINSFYTEQDTICQ